MMNIGNVGNVVGNVVSYP